MNACSISARTCSLATCRTVVSSKNSCTRSRISKVRVRRQRGPVTEVTGPKTRRRVCFSKRRKSVSGGQTLDYGSCATHVQGGEDAGLQARSDNPRGSPGGSSVATYRHAAGSGARSNVDLQSHQTSRLRPLVKDCTTWVDNRVALQGRSPRRRNDRPRPPSGWSGRNRPGS